MPAMPPGLRAECCETAAAAVVAGAGAPLVEAVGFAGDALDDEELEPAAPGGFDSSGQSCSLGQQAADHMSILR